MIKINRRNYELQIIVGRLCRVVSIDIAPTVVVIAELPAEHQLKKVRNLHHANTRRDVLH